MEYMGEINKDIVNQGNDYNVNWYVVRNDFGSFTGYAELPDDWHDGDEDDLLVHGGVTFRGKLNGVEVIGFDTADELDYDIRWSLNEVVRETKERLARGVNDSITYRRSQKAR